MLAWLFSVTAFSFYTCFYENYNHIVHWCWSPLSLWLFREGLFCFAEPALCLLRQKLAHQGSFPRLTVPVSWAQAIPGMSGTATKPAFKPWSCHSPAMWPCFGYCLVLWASVCTSVVEWLWGVEASRDLTEKFLNEWQPLIEIVLNNTTTGGFCRFSSFDFFFGEESQEWDCLAQDCWHFCGFK